MRRDEAYLLDMLIAARDAISCLGNLSPQEFRKSRLHQLAVLKAVETVGEAAARVSETTRTLHPDIPWREIVGMRHRLVHGYFEVDLEIIWSTVRNDLPPLVARLQEIVPPEGS